MLLLRLLGGMLAAFLLLAFSQSASAAGIRQSTCALSINSSNTSHQLPSAPCTNASITFQKNVYNSGVRCWNAPQEPVGYVALAGNDIGDYLINCTLANPSVLLANHTSLYIIGTDNATFAPSFVGNSSNVTVAHYLRVNVFEPFGYNSSIFGSRVAGFSYIFPLMNNTFRFSNSELQMSEFFGNFTSRFAALSNSIPFGAYNASESEIYENATNTAYGAILGSRLLAVPDYTLYKGHRMRYNPYEVDYSYLAYDQLVAFRLNITRNMNLTPIYIEPLYPGFNWNIIPDNGTNQITIRYVIAVPPQDQGWNFTAYLYRYKPTEFVVNPVAQGVGPESVLYKAASSGANYSLIRNGTVFYLINYTTKVGVGLNSSIVSLLGKIPGAGSFVEDSTTPSFSFGLGYCTPANNQAVSSPGTYNMVSMLLPLAGPALPQLIDVPCTRGIVVRGSSININCRGGLINDTAFGIIIENSQNVSIRDCRIEGNGLKVTNSSGIGLYNLTLIPTNVKDFGAIINNTRGVTFKKLTIGGSYTTPLSVLTSTGTPFSEGIQVYNLSVCNANDLSEIRQGAYIYSWNSTCGSGLATILVPILNQYTELAVLTAVLAAIYLYIFLRPRRWTEARKKNTKRN